MLLLPPPGSITAWAKGTGGSQPICLPACLSACLPLNLRAVSAVFIKLYLALGASGPYHRATNGCSEEQQDAS